MRRRALWSLAAVAALAACTMQQAPAVPPTTITALTGDTSAAPNQGVETLRTSIEGAVRLPATMVATGAMNMIAVGSLNLVAAGGMNLVSVGSGALVSVGSGALVSVGSGAAVAAGPQNYALNAIEQNAIANVTVFLCDAFGKPIPGLAPVVTDASGKFTIPDVPAGFTLVTNAVVEFSNGKRGNLATLVHTGDESANDINPGTTLTAIRAAAGHEGRDLGYFDTKLFKQAADVANNSLSEGSNPDWLDANAIGKRAAAMDTDIAGFREPLKRLRPQLGTTTATVSVEAFIRALATPKPVPTPTPTPTPRPTLAPTPTPGPTATPYRDPVLEACGIFVRHTFRPSVGGGNRLVFRIRKPTDRDRLNWPVAAVANLTNNVSAPIELPEGCEFRVELLSGTQKLADNDIWKIPVGAPEMVEVQLN